jgi:hypothetical protein
MHARQAQAQYNASDLPTCSGADTLLLCWHAGQAPPWPASQAMQGKGIQGQAWCIYLHPSGFWGQTEAKTLRTQPIDT